MGKSKIYTKTGDKGSTSLVGGKRVQKTDIRLEAYGTIDELNSFTGLLIEEVSDVHHRELLRQIQSLLFIMGSHLATEAEESNTLDSLCVINPEAIKLLEEEIDALDGSLPRLKDFILPGGSRGSALSHICRTICRRAERRIYQLNEMAEVDPNLLMFINRLSDFYFIFARKLCFEEYGREIIWQKTCL